MITGDELRQLREQAGLSQEDLASRLSISQRQMRAWEDEDELPMKREQRVLAALNGARESVDDFAPKDEVDIHVTVSMALLLRIDAFASLHGAARSKAIGALIESALE